MVIIYERYNRRANHRKENLEMKKIIWVTVILCLLQTSYTFASTSGMSDGQGYTKESPQNKMIYFYRSQEEIDKATMDVGVKKYYWHIFSSRRGWNERIHGF